MKRAKLFKNNNRNEILNKIYNDYVDKDLSMTELAEKYGFTVRQIRYILDRYLLVKKGKGKRKHMDDIVKVDDELILVNGKIAKRATLKDLIEKAEIYKDNLNNNDKSTNKKVENK